MAQSLPHHLRKYVVEQNYSKYTPLDQACWRYILRQLRSFLSVHAHESYLEGLKKTGIDVECIPKIEEVSEKLQKFGWRALPVSGFIPPAAFMELQSLGVLPIASDMRTIDHLMYTPAPDIVHEAAGHAPILIHPEFADYLKKYSQVARKAIISKEDLDLYEAIRDLSDIKENPSSTPEEIKNAEANLDRVSKSISHISEASELSRMNWWTAEYGLIGDLKNPKIFGAGLLSSVGESKWCLSENVKKIPLTVDCIKQGYDITEPQPQLFVTPDFQTLHHVLEDMAQNMAFRKGGLESVRKVIQAKSVNTVELNSGLQISGIVTEVLTTPQGSIAYLKLSGPCQLSHKDQQLPLQGTQQHPQGFGTPLGRLKGFTKNLHELSEIEIQNLNLGTGASIQFEFESGIKVTGQVIEWTRRQNTNLILSLNNAKAEWNGEVLFDPSWGTYDMALGTEIPSVFGGPADRVSFGETDDFVAKKVPTPKYSTDQIRLFNLYQEVRQIRDKKLEANSLSVALESLFEVAFKDFANEWLLFLEMFELLNNRDKTSNLTSKILTHLEELGRTSEKNRSVIQDGLNLAGNL